MLENVSYRYKIPAALMLAILLTELAVTAALVALTLSDARRNVESGARNLANVTTLSIRDSLMRDDLYRVFEVIRAPIDARELGNPLKQVIVLDSAGRVYASTNPKFSATWARASSLGEPVAVAIRQVHANPEFFYLSFPSVFALDDVVAAQAVLAEDGSFLGYVVVTYDTGKVRGEIATLLIRMVLLSLFGLLLLLPIAWWWGKRMATPLHRLSDAMERVHTAAPEILKSEVDARGRDEIGALSASFRGMLDELSEKRQLEREMVVSERLAAVGRVAAGIAHEINNPLGGLINAVDTLAKHGAPDGLTSRTLGLLERGLTQIRSTVGALLIEARLDSPAMGQADWDDLQILVHPEVITKNLQMQWSVPADTVALPSHLLRQLVLNLLLNAVKAVEEGGTVSCTATASPSEVCVLVSNTGEHIPEHVVNHVFEPYSPNQKSAGVRSYGLGLWVSYQIVTQLRGTISVSSQPGQTTFEVVLPITAGDKT
ncbi:ATP-binding protein [Caballeronia sp. DA-9]|uniref:sensor histidine kinase n=1 Tax=Caballeronia sp. DA-9 TaxID=3436237 RepID=UPI003F66B745